MLRVHLPKQFARRSMAIRLTGIGALFLAGLAIFVFAVVAPRDGEKETAEKGGRSGNAAEQAKETASDAKREDPFAELELQAKAAFVWDIENREAIYSRNPDAALPLASLTKVMNALVVADTLNPSAVVTIDREALAEEGDTGLLRFEKWHLKDLLSFSLITSSNDGASAAAASASSAISGQSEGDRSTAASSTARRTASVDRFIDRMNDKAQKIGMDKTRFYNENGLDQSSSTAGAYGSARDMTKLFEYALRYYPEIVTVTRNESLVFESLSNITHKATNTNEISDRLPGLLASKTGYTSLAGGNLVVAFNPGLKRPIVIAVLGSTINGRFEDVLKLKDAVIEHLSEE